MVYIILYSPPHNGHLQKIKILNFHHEIQNT